MSRCICFVVFCRYLLFRICLILALLMFSSWLDVIYIAEAPFSSQRKINMLAQRFPSKQSANILPHYEHSLRLRQCLVDEEKGVKNSRLSFRLFRTSALRA